MPGGSSTGTSQGVEKSLGREQLGLDIVGTESQSKEKRKESRGGKIRKGLFPQAFRFSAKGKTGFHGLNFISGPFKKQDARIANSSWVRLHGGSISERGMN